MMPNIQAMEMKMIPGILFGIVKPKFMQMAGLLKCGFPIQLCDL